MPPLPSSRGFMTRDSAAPSMISPKSCRSAESLFGHTKRRVTREPRAHLGGLSVPNRRPQTVLLAQPLERPGPAVQRRRNETLLLPAQGRQRAPARFRAHLPRRPRRRPRARPRPVELRLASRSLAAPSPPASPGVRPGVRMSLCCVPKLRAHPRPPQQPCRSGEGTDNLTLASDDRTAVPAQRPANLTCSQNS